MKHAIRHIHFVGIGGSGMSGIAEVLLNQGYVISGTDLGENAATRRLVSLGATVHKGHDAKFIEGADAIVTSDRRQGRQPRGGRRPREADPLWYRAQSCWPS